MASKKLNTEDLKSIKLMFVEGKSAKEIANHFSVSSSTVNNLKAKFKSEGVVFGSKRDLRSNLTVIIKEKKETKPVGSIKYVKKEDYYFLIDGVKVSVSSNAKKVHIEKNFMIIDF